MVPSITVAVCVYNTPKKLLDDCMKSLVSQDYSNFDILIVDNHSTEKETLGSLSYWVENYSHIVRIIHKKENRGLHDSRNIAIKNCKGQYIAFVDSDDVVAKNYLSKLAFNVSLRGGLIISKIGFKRFSENCSFEHKNIKPSFFDRNESLLRLLTERIMPSVWGTLFPVLCFDGFLCSEENGVDDMQMNLYAFDKCDFVVYSEEQLYGWRNFTGSSMKNNKFLHMVDFSLLKWLDYAENKCHDAVPYLKFRLAISSVKCSIVDKYREMKWHDFVLLITPYISKISKSLKTSKILFLTKKQRLSYKFMCRFKHLYCSMYAKKRNLM